MSDFSKELKKAIVSKKEDHKVEIQGFWENIMKKTVGYNGNSLASC